MREAGSTNPLPPPPPQISNANKANAKDTYNVVENKCSNKGSKLQTDIFDFRQKRSKKVGFEVFARKTGVKC